MAGAADSGMDMLLEISGAYVEQIIRRKFAAMGRVCLSAEEVDLDLGALVDIRRVIPAIDSVTLAEAGEVEKTVTLTVNLRLLYGRYRIHQDEETPIDGASEEGWADIPIAPPEIAAILTVWPETDRILLILDEESLPDWLPTEWLDTLGSPADIPQRPDGRLLAAISIDFFNQTDAGTGSVLLRALPDLPFLRVIAGNLVIGVDLDFSQDDEPTFTDADGNVVAHRCGLPDNTDPDLLRFLTVYASSLLDRYDWAMALDRHVVDAILHGQPAARLNDPETDDCENDGALRKVCLRVAELRDGVAIVRGSAEAFVCPEEFFVADGYYAADFEAELRLSIEGQPSRLRAAYEITDATLQDPIQDCLVDALSQIDEDKRSGSLSLRSLPTTLGEPDDPAGRLSMQEALIRTDGLILRGLGSVRQPEAPQLVAPERVLFAAGCTDLPSTAMVEIRNLGNSRLHLCPPVIRAAPDGDDADAALFRVTAPRRMRASGAGRSLDLHESVELTLAFDGEADRRYVARLELPNNVATHRVELIADLREARLAALPEEVRIERVEFLRGRQGFPPVMPIRRGIHVVNDGEGHMQVCGVEFVPENPDGVFSVELPGVFEREGIVRVSFDPGEAGVNRDYDCTLRIATNGGSGEVRLHARLDHSEDAPFGNFSGGFGDGYDGEADWDAARNHGGSLLAADQLAEMLDILGGTDCCPPPRGPDCQCVDLLSMSMRNVPRNARIQLFNTAGDIVAQSSGTAPTRFLISPLRAARGYGLRAELAGTGPVGRRSAVRIQRLLLQQEGLYQTTGILAGIAAAGQHGYAAGRDGLHIIRLANAQRPVRARLATSLAGADAVAVSGKHLVLLDGGLKFLSLDRPEQPALVGSRSLGAAAHALLAFDRWCIAAGPNYLQVVDASDPAAAKQVAAVRVGVPARSMARRGRHLFLGGKGGIEAFDVGDPSRPESIGTLALDGEIRNLIALGMFLIAIRDAGAVHVIDIRRPSRPVVAEARRVEDWLSPYVPVAGAVVRHDALWLLLTADQRGVRLMRPRVNEVNLEQLRARRARA